MALLTVMTIDIFYLTIVIEVYGMWHIVVVGRIETKCSISKSISSDFLKHLCIYSREACFCYVLISMLQKHYVKCIFNIDLDV